MYPCFCSNELSGQLTNRVDRLSLAFQKRGGLSAFLALEIVLAFHHCTCKHALHFDQFMGQFLLSVERFGDLRHLDSLTFIEAFQRMCDPEGTECRMSLDSLHTSLQVLILQLDTAGRSLVNASRYSAIVKDLKHLIVGLCDQLIAQNFVMTCSSIGLYLPCSFMAFFETGCSQQLRNLKVAPFFFERADQVVQLRKHFMVRGPELLAVQADEMIRTLSKEKPVARTMQLVLGKRTPYVARREIDGSVVVLRYCSQQKRVSKAPVIVFNYGVNRNHYIPQWVSRGTDRYPPVHG